MRLLDVETNEHEQIDIEQRFCSAKIIAVQEKLGFQVKDEDVRLE